MSFRYFVIGSGSIGRRHAENLTTLGAEVTHYGWRGINLDAVTFRNNGLQRSSGRCDCNRDQSAPQLITECSKAGAALYIEKPVAYRTDDIQKIFDLPPAHWNVRSLGS